MKKELNDKVDIRLLMNKFYAKATQDKVIGIKFDHIDMKEHIPKIVEFWSAVILYEGDYKGSPFDKHIPLNLEPKDFERWLYLFEEITFENFEGEKADEIVKRAKSIGRIFQFKIQSLNQLS